MSIGGTERLPGLDALRVGLILLGIPFHAALPYAEGAVGILQADRLSELVAILVVVLRALRMPAFFLVAGFFAARLLARRPALDWFRDRFVRLMMPFVVGMAAIVPLQRWIADVYRAETGLALDVRIPSFHHLWFLLILFAFCLVTVLVRPLLDRGLAGLVRLTGGLRAGLRAEFAFGSLVAVAVLWELAVKSIFEAEPLVAAHFAGTVRLAMVYGPWFVVGYGLGRIPGTMAWFMRPSGLAAGLALAFLAIDLAVAKVPNLESFHAPQLAAWTAASWYVARVAVAATARLPFAAAPLVRRLGDWTMPIYVLHHPWTMVFALLMLGTHWPAELQFLAVTFLALVATWSSCVIVAHVPLLALLLNGRHLPPLAPTVEPTPARVPASVAHPLL